MANINICVQDNLLKKIIKLNLNDEENILNKLFKEIRRNELLKIKKEDPNSPFYSDVSFDALHLNINLLKAINEMGFKTPSKIQAEALPILLANPPINLIAQSQSGTGKTATFVSAMISRVDPTKNYPQVLCLLPTFELAFQIGEVTKKFLKYYSNINIKTVVTGKKAPKNKILNQHILIGTPGKVLNWGSQNAYFDLKKITVLVVDEADLMFDKGGHGKQCFLIYQTLSPKCQKMFFSATYKENIMHLLQSTVSNPFVIELDQNEICLDNIKQYYVQCEKDGKYGTLIKLLSSYESVSKGQCIIFCRTRLEVESLSDHMASDGKVITYLRGNLNRNQRILIFKRFLTSDIKVIIATNILARGIDVENVNLVINYNLPDREIYLHRIGRAGRFALPGTAISLIDSENELNCCENIAKYFNKEIIELKFTGVNTSL